MAVSGQGVFGVSMGSDAASLGLDRKALAKALTDGDAREEQQWQAYGHTQLRTSNPDEECRQKALCKVMLLFWRKGTDSTRYTDIVDATGWSLKSLYRNWSDKQALIGDALALYRAQEIGRILSELDKGGQSGLFGFWREQELEARKPNWRGCLLFRTAMSQGGNQNTALLLDDYLDELQARIGKAVIEGQRAGEIDKTIDAETAGWQCVSALALISAVGFQSGYCLRVSSLFAAARKSCGL